jgi:tRNA pseudouridine55 synthase
MSRRARGKDIHGIVLLDKPAGISSNRALQKVRGIFQARKAGHTGSLDPFATGMLPICLGEASKTAAHMLTARKYYRAGARLGVATASGDSEGEITRAAPVPDLDAAAIEAALAQFRGTIEQVPPMYSALKHRGKPLYAYAREGIEIERAPREITIEELRFIDWQPPLLAFEVRCSKGTYVRTLAEDIAAALDTCAHLVSLRRIYTEPFTAQPMATLEQLQQAREQGCLAQYLLAVDAGLPDWQRVELGPEQQDRFCHGNSIADAAARPRAGNVRVYARGGGLLGLGTLEQDGTLHPRRVFKL